MEQYEQSQELYKLLGFNFVALIVVILFLQFYFAKGKRVNKMTNEVYLNQVSIRELNKLMRESETLEMNATINWRSSLNPKFNNYCL